MLGISVPPVELWRRRPYTSRVGGDRTGSALLEHWLESGGAHTLDRFTGQSRDVIAVVDHDHVIHYLNSTAAGLTKAAVIGQSAFTMIPPSEASVAREAFDAALLEGTAAQFEITYPGESGIMVFVVRVSPIVHEGQVLGALTINTDATEQRRANTDRDRFFSLSLDMFVVVTPEGMLRRLNPAFYQALGYSQTELVGKSFVNLVHPDDLVRSQDAFRQVLAGQPIHDFENRYRRKDGAYRIFSWRTTADPVTGDLYAVARDITEQRTTEAQLRHAQKMEAVGLLAGGIAHDFNNLMQAVLANVEVALLPESSRQEMEENLREIEAAGRRAAELTKQLLVFSRRQRLHRVPLDLHAVVQGLMKLLGRLLPESIVIDIRTSRDLPAVSADRTQLEQVVTNLCVNARDAMENGGKLTLETGDVVFSGSDGELYPWARPGHFVCLSVTDTGQGMSPQVRERVFEPFFTTKGHRSGTGLGLSTLYGIVQQHGGMVHVYSDEGLGTTFKIYLPADERSAVVPPTPDAQPAPPLHGSETILIAEDEEVVRKPLLRILRGAGYQTLVATNGREAIELLREHLDTIDLVVLDVVMPEMGGPEAWQIMRSLRSDLRVVFMSGYADIRDRDRLPDDVEVLDKPFPSQELLARIRRQLGAS